MIIIFIAQRSHCDNIQREHMLTKVKFIAQMGRAKRESIGAPAARMIRASAILKPIELSRIWSSISVNLLWDRIWNLDGCMCAPSASRDRETEPHSSNCICATSKRYTSYLFVSEFLLSKLRFNFINNLITMWDYGDSQVDMSVYEWAILHFDRHNNNI